MTVFYGILLYGKKKHFTERTEQIIIYLVSYLYS